MCRAGADYRRGDQHPNIAIVGACPGAVEEREGRPFIGDAGTHLTEMVRTINGISPTKFPSVRRDDYTLLNAHPQARYQIRGQPNVQTEPTPREVLEEENVRRLIQQIRSTEINRLLLGGGKPRLLIQPIIQEFPGMEVFICGHPSSGAWNRHYIGQPRAEKIRLWTHDTFQMHRPFCVHQ